MSSNEIQMNEARKLSTDTAHVIAIAANTMKHPIAFAGLTGSLVFQTIITSIAIDQFKPGSKEGEEWIEKMYERALKDAKERWHRPDLKGLGK